MKTKNKQYPVVLITLSGLLVSSCSYLDIGESEYACPGRKNGVTCASTREIYDRTHNDQVPIGVPIEVAQRSENTLKKENDLTKGSKPNRDALKEERNTQVVENYISPNLPLGEIPIRTPAKVMRIWLAPWEDEEGDLNISGYIYTEIEPRKWVITEPKDLTHKDFNSLK